MKNLMVTLFGFFLFMASSHATCMQTCEDVDAGLDPTAFGVVTQVTSCSPPGGPVRSTTKIYFDSCDTGLHVEYSCDGAMTGIGVAKQRLYRCRACHPTRAGVCVTPVAAGPITDAQNEKHSYSTVSGSGPDPFPTLEPIPATPIPSFPRQ